MRERIARAKARPVGNMGKFGGIEKATHKKQVLLETTQKCSVRCLKDLTRILLGGGDLVSMEALFGCY